MKTSLILRLSLARRLRCIFLRAAIIIAGICAASFAHAGLTLEMNVIRYHQYGYYFSPNLGTNTTGATVPFGDYYIVSSSFPTTGSSALYHFDSSGFNQTGGYANGFGDYNGMIQELTNIWSIYVTNSVTTNVYHFAVTANITSNDLPYVNITFPADGSVNIPNQPNFTWQGPTNYSDLVVYAYNASSYLPVTQTNWLSPNVLYQGLSSFTPHYDSNSTTAVVSSIPTNSAGQPLTTWVSTDHLQDFATSTFTVGMVDASGTSHTLVAHYAWDNTNGDGSASGVDTSGNGYDLNFGGGYGSQGGVNSTTTSEAGAHALQFHDGDGNSGGYVGWNPMPGGVLTALSGSFSVSCWIKTMQNNFGGDNDPAYYGAGIVSADNGGLQNDVIPIALTGNKIGFNTGGSTEDITLNSSASVNDGSYHHIVVTRNQTTGQKIIYIDGVLDSFSSGTTNLLNDPQKITIGALADASDPDPTDFNYYNGFDGELDDLQFYSGVISSNDVAYLFANPGSTVTNGGGGSDFANALNTTNLAWTSGGDLSWFTESTVTLDGLAAESGQITDSQSSYIQTTVPANGQLSFNWKVSSEDGYDFLTFYINDNEQDAISGEQDWNQETYSVSAGDVLRWEYSKDSSDSDGLDAGFLDEINYNGNTNPNFAPIITVNPFSQTNYPGYNVALLAAATSNPAATWQWYKTGNGSPISNATNALYIPANSGTAGVAGSYYAIASNLSGSATTTVAVVTFQNAALPPDWNIAFKTPFYNNASDATTNYNIACLLDPTGTNIYTVGSFVGTNFFGANTLISQNGAGESAFLKQTTSGIAVWGACMTNNGNGSSFAECIASAPGGGFYVGGDFFGTNWLGTNKLVDVANGSTYVARFDANGNNLWIQTVSGTNSNFTEYHDITSDPSGNVTLSALISGGTRVGTSNIVATGQRGLLAQFDPNGNLRWLQLPSGWPSYLVYNNGCIYGTMGGNTTNYIGGVTNVSDRHQVLFSINATTGQGNWLRGMAASITNGNPYGFADDGALVAVSSTNIFVAGMAWGSNAAFGPYTMTFPTSKGEYFARYDTNGNPQLATAFGSEYTWTWSIQSDAAGDVYIGSDFDHYSVFGKDILAAPFYETVQSLNSFAPGAYIPGQTCVAKFDRNGNPLWARLAESQSSYLNSRDIALASDGVWSCGLFNQQSIFGSITINGAITCVGSPFCTPNYHPSGYLAKITDSSTTTNALAVTLLNPLDNGTNFQFQFLSQSGFTHAVQYRTNLIAGSTWQTYSNVTGDGTLKIIPIPLSVFNPARQGFVRILTQ